MTALAFFDIQWRKIGILRGNLVWSILVTYLALQINCPMECISHLTEYKRQTRTIISPIYLNLPLYLPTQVANTVRKRTESSEFQLTSDWSRERSPSPEAIGGI